MTKTIADLVYVDSSALFKLVARESETAALRRELDRWGRLVSSALTATEVSRALLRAAPALLPRAAALLADVDQLTLSRTLLQHAATLQPPLLRTLDAMHLATALAIGPRLGALITYDRRMATAATWHGLTVLSPS